MASFIYIITNGTEFKIGCSKHPDQRLKELQTANSFELSILFTFETEYGFKLEKSIQRFMSHCNQKGEGFCLTNDDINNIKKLCNNLEQGYSYENVT